MNHSPEGPNPTVAPNRNSSFYQALSALYDDLYADVDAKEAVRQWALLIKLIDVGVFGANRGLLDLGCGTGQYLDAWAEQGFSVTGMDVNEGMVTRARRRARASNWHSRIHIVKGDARVPVSSLGRFSPFALAVAHFNFLNLFPTAEVAEVLKALRMHMAPGGRLVTDCASPRMMPRPCVESLTLPRNQTIHVRTVPERAQKSVSMVYTLADREIGERYWLHSAPDLAAAARSADCTLESVRLWRPDREDNPWPTGRAGTGHRVCIFKF
jgi:SAM-dependent methyltransferase